MDVTLEEAVRVAYEETAVTFGGVDIIVNNAGLATSSPFDETSLKEWNLNINVLGTGYFLVAREAFKLMKQTGHRRQHGIHRLQKLRVCRQQCIGLRACKAGSALSAADIAAEGGEFGIRVNTILPDAILQGSAMERILAQRACGRPMASSPMSWKSTIASAQRCS